MGQAFDLESRQPIVSLNTVSLNTGAGIGMERMAWPPPPGVVAAGGAVYLRPRAIARRRDEAPGSERIGLAGGPLGFGVVDVVFRASHAMHVATASLAGLHAWMAGEGAAYAAAIEAALSRLSAPRASFAGVALDAPVIMGIINVTPDSFSDGGRFLDRNAAIEQGLALAQAGARILDVGGESTRPGAAPVGLSEELDRVLPVIEGLRSSGAILSIDTRHAAVAKAALKAGATIVNDVTALADPESAEVARSAGAAVVLMHMQGDPGTMQKAPRYDFSPVDVFEALGGRVAAAEAAGLRVQDIAVDPGIGFGKTAAHNVEILDWLALFHGLGRPLMVGVSRKSFIAAISRGEPVEKRLAGSLAAGLAAVEAGAQILRVHDVAETVSAVTVWQRIRG